MKIVFILFCFISFLAKSQDTTYLKVHFLYGSKPLKAFKDSEKKWFGGILGGHVGVEKDSNEIVNFVPRGELHWVNNEDEKHSAFVTYRYTSFYSILGGNADSVKKAIIYIPISRQQMQKFDSISAIYRDETPYDYAFWGMRCGAAAYDILSHVDILPQYRYKKTFKKIFYPKKLRKRLLRMANENHWKVIKEEGSTKRKWEKD